MKVKEENEKVGLKPSIQKTKIMASGHHFMANRWRNSGNCRGPAPAGPGIPKGWVASARKKTDRQTHTDGCIEEVVFFIFLFLGELSFCRMNVTSHLSHHTLHQVSVCASINIFFSPCFSPKHSSRTFPITGFILKCPIHSLLASMAWHSHSSKNNVPQISGIV